MGIIPNQMVKMEGVANRNYYESLGYDLPKHISYGKICHDSSKSFWIDALDLPKNSGKKIGCFCDHCGKTMKMSMASYTKYNHNGDIYCVKCANKIFHSGENCNLWNPNLTDEQRKKNRHNSEYDNFTRKVLARDNYSCQICGCTGNNMEVHHLDGYNWCVEKRTDVSNGITLCKTHHTMYHERYGKGNNTKKEFEDWAEYIKLNTDDYFGEIKIKHKVYCFENDTLYKDVFDAANSLNIKVHDVYSCCGHNSKSAKRYHFVYEYEYLQLTDKQKDKIKNDIYNYRLDKRIICLNTSEVFKGMKDVCEKYDYIKLQNISSHLNKPTKYIGCKINNLYAVFMYYEDYCNISHLEAQNILINNQPKPKYICLNNLKTYYTMDELENDIGIRICAVDVHIRNINISSHAGKDRNTGQPLIWMRYEDYINASNDVINYRLSFANPKIICTTTGNAFYKYIDGANKYSTSTNGIKNVLNGFCRTSGKLPDGTPLKWMYYSDFINFQNDKQLEIIEENINTIEEGSYLYNIYKELTSSKTA